MAVMAVGVVVAAVPPQSPEGEAVAVAAGAIHKTVARQAMAEPVVQAPARRRRSNLRVVEEQVARVRLREAAPETAQEPVPPRRRSVVRLIRPRAKPPVATRARMATGLLAAMAMFISRFNEKLPARAVIFTAILLASKLFAQDVDPE